MQLEAILAAGAYLSAGFVDFYDTAKQKHARLGSVSAGGDFVLTKEGQAWVDQHQIAALAALEVPAEPAEPVKEDVQVVAELLPTGPTGSMSLDELLA